MANTTNNRVRSETRSSTRMTSVWNRAHHGENKTRSTVERSEPVHPAEDDHSPEAASEVALLCANIQADAGHTATIGDLAGLLQTLYALTTAVATADKKPSQDAYLTGAIATTK